MSARFVECLSSVLSLVLFKSTNGTTREFFSHTKITFIHASFDKVIKCQVCTLAVKDTNFLISKSFDSIYLSQHICKVCIFACHTQVALVSLTCISKVHRGVSIEAVKRFTCCNFSDNGKLIANCHRPINFSSPEL